ncbi:CHAT domain-containing protein, partial [Pseudomonadota bacterium]
PVAPAGIPQFRIHPGAGLQTGLPQTVFLAGHPRDYSGEYATRLDTSTEIRTVADIFVGPGLSIVQGTALLPDEFETEEFQQAQLAHLSMPGIIDLKYPDQSGLELSGTEFSTGRISLQPRDIQANKLQTDLVFLSATSVRETPLSGFSSQPGLISDFIDAGAHSVIARSWTSRGGIGESFISDFYRQLGISGNISAALANAKRDYLKSNRANGLYDWAGYQLYTN